ncbi:hypothetical protein ACJX0J_031576, partial [Zea mays]
MSFFIFVIFALLCVRTDSKKFKFLLFGSQISEILSLDVSENTFLSMYVACNICFLFWIMYIHDEWILTNIPLVAFETMIKIPFFAGTEAHYFIHGEFIMFSHCLLLIICFFAGIIVSMHPLAFKYSTHVVFGVLPYPKDSFLQLKQIAQILGLITLYLVKPLNIEHFTVFLILLFLSIIGLAFIMHCSASLIHISFSCLIVFVRLTVDIDRLINADCLFLSFITEVSIKSYFEKWTFGKKILTHEVLRHLLGHYNSRFTPEMTSTTVKHYYLNTLRTTGVRG